MRPRILKGKQADKSEGCGKPAGRPAKADKAAPDKAKPQPRDKKCPKANRLPEKALRHGEGPWLQPSSRPRMPPVA